MTPKSKAKRFVIQNDYSTKHTHYDKPSADRFIDRVFYDPAIGEGDMGGWCFWNKDGTWFYGPYESEEAARRTLARFQKDGIDE